MKKLKVLVACEYSGRVRDAFIRAGHDAVSCDFLESESDLGLHFTGCVFTFLNMFPDYHFDLMICHPPCTFLTGAAEWAFDDVPMIKGKPRKMKPGTLIGAERREARLEALDFVDRLWTAKVKRKCLENPVGVITSRRPGMGRPQYVQQYWFGEDASKKTGLWLDGLKPLAPTNKIAPRTVIISGKEYKRWGNQTDSGQNKLPPSADRWKIRSTTPQGLADAMAIQWGGEP